MSDNPDEIANYSRFITMYIDLATATVLKVFVQLTPDQDGDTFLASDEVRKKLKNMVQQNKLNKKEFMLLERRLVKPNKFDVSLLITLVINLHSANVSPAMEKDLIRLRKIRNDIIAHHPRARMEESRFEFLWREVEKILVGLTKHVDFRSEATLTEEIRKYRTRPLDPNDEHLNTCREKIQEWFDGWSKLQGKVEEMLQKAKELELFFKRWPQSYCNYIKLLIDGGKLVLPELLDNELLIRNKTLQTVLQENYLELTEAINDDKLVKQAFPEADKDEIPNARDWDILVIASVVICLLDESTDEEVMTDIRTILEARRNYALIAVMFLDNDRCNSLYMELTSSLRGLSSGLNSDIKKRCRTILTNYNKEPQEREVDVKYFEELKGHGPQIKSIANVYNEKLKELKEMVKKMEEDEINFQKQHELVLKLVTTCDNEEKRKDVEDSVSKFCQDALDGSAQSTDFDAVRNVFELIFDEIRKIPGVGIVGVDRHCILLSLRCSSWHGLYQLLEYVHFDTGDHLQFISRELSVIYNTNLAIQGHLTFECLHDTIQRLHYPMTTDTNTELRIPIKCNSPGGMRQVLEVLSDEKTTNRLNEIADIYSHRVGDIVTLGRVTDLTGFTGVFEETDSSCDSLDDETNQVWGSQAIDGASNSSSLLNQGFHECYVIQERFGDDMFPTLPDRTQPSTKFVANLSVCHLRKILFSHELCFSFESFISNATYLQTLVLESVRCLNNGCNGHTIYLSKGNCLQSITLEATNQFSIIGASSNIKSCEVIWCNFSHEQCASLSRFLSNAVSLRTLLLQDVECSLCECKGHSIDFSDHKNLHSLTLDHCNQICVSSANPEYLDVCEIKDCKISHEQYESLSLFLSKTASTTTIVLKSVECVKDGCKGHCIDLSNHDQLESITFEKCVNLYISGVNCTHPVKCVFKGCYFTHEQCETVSSVLSNAPSITCLDMASVICTKQDCYGHTIDLSNLRHLQRLSLEDCANMFISGVSSDTLQSCAISFCKISHDQYTVLSEITMNALSLETLVLQSIKCSGKSCSGHDIDLSYHDKLNTLRLKYCDKLTISGENWNQLKTYEIIRSDNSYVTHQTLVFIVSKCLDIFL